MWALAYRNMSPREMGSDRDHRYFHIGPRRTIVGSYERPVNDQRNGVNWERPFLIEITECINR